MSTSPIAKVDELLRFLRGLPQAKARIYRGQNTTRPLVPKFARMAKERRLTDPRRTEQELFEAFCRLSRPYLDFTPMDTFEWLAIAQHHGLPTRLLDWTGNPLFALWFAVRSETSSDDIEDGTFWVLDIQDQHFVPHAEKRKDIYDLQQTRVFRPPHVTERIVAQDGWFTVHWYVEKRNKFVSLERNRNYKQHLHHRAISRHSFQPLRDELRNLGITDRVLFPDLVTLCQEITKDFFE